MSIYDLLGEASLEDGIDYLVDCIVVTDDSRTRLDAMLELEDLLPRPIEQLPGNPWRLTKDGDFQVVHLHTKHYSRRPGKRRNSLIVGPGRKIVLKTEDGRAAWAWRLELFRDDKRYGANNVFFRNEGPFRSSFLIAAAEEWLQFWPVDTMFTFIDPRKVRSTNPGYIYKLAGWQAAGTTKTGKLIFTKRTWSWLLETAELIGG